MSAIRDDRPSTASKHAAISREIVRLLREYTGRGPTKARTHINRDLITVVLEDTLTMGERSLIADGKDQHVLATRKAFQETMSSKMVAAVEQHSGRQVLAFLSANHIDPDIAVETFVLVPDIDDETQPSRPEKAWDRASEADQGEPLKLGPHRVVRGRSSRAA
jgi:uncharacterized protein YbcI